MIAVVAAKEDEASREAKHLARIGGGLLYAATSNVPWPILLARTFDVDIKVCARCGGGLDVRAVITDHDVGRKILDAVQRLARPPPRPVAAAAAPEPALAGWPPQRRCEGAHGRRSSLRPEVSHTYMPATSFGRPPAVSAALR